MKNNYYSMLNESFNKLLLEAQQVVVDFKNIFGKEMYDRFKTQKQRMSAPENDVSYWVNKYNNEGEGVIDELDEFISNFEDKLTRREKRQVAEEGAELIYEDDDWKVFHITTYEAAAKYGSHTKWCITGRYEGHEDIGLYWFNHYLGKDEEGNAAYTGYYFFIKKGNDNEKYCVCPLVEGGYEIWDPKDGRPDYVPNGPENVPGLEDVPVEKDDSYDYEYENDEDNEPGEWTDENGHVWHGRRPPRPEETYTMDLDDPDSFEFEGDEASVLRQFSEKGFNGVEIVEEIPNTPIKIVKFVVDPEHQEFEMDDDEIYTRDLPGERYTAFVFFPGQGGGPLLTGPQGKLIVSRTIDGAKRPFIHDNFNAANIHANADVVESNQGQHAPLNNDDDMEEALDCKNCGNKKAKRKGNYYSDYANNLKESDNCGCYSIIVGDEAINDIDGKTLCFKSESDAKKYALDELELLPDDFTIKCNK